MASVYLDAKDTWPPLQGLNDLVIKAINVYTEEAEVLQPASFQDQVEAVFASVNEGVYTDDRRVLAIRDLQILESRRIAFDHQRAPSLQDEYSAVAEMNSIPRAELAAGLVAGAHHAEDVLDDSVLSVLRVNVLFVQKQTSVVHLNLLVRGRTFIGLGPRPSEATLLACRQGTRRCASTQFHAWFLVFISPSLPRSSIVFAISQSLE
jgi:hypothetical protein